MADPGNTFNTATSISPGLTPQILPRDSVQFGDEDFYRFRVLRTSSLQLTVGGLNGNADVELYRQTSPATGPLVTAIYTDVNGIVATSLNQGTLPEAITATLEPGTYFIRVLPGPPADSANAAGTTPSTNYDLSVSIDNGLRSDIVWRNAATRENVVWRMNGAVREATVFLPNVNVQTWQTQGLGNFNNDNQPDIVWRNTATGENVIWLMNGASLSQVVSLPSVTNLSWQIGGTGDFNGDNETDIVWRNYSTGENVVWTMNDTTRTGILSLPAVANLNAFLQGVGDFNADGRPDLLFRDFNTGSSATGRAFVNLMNGTQLLQSVNLLSPTSLNLQIQGTGDFNGDESTDILWRNFQTGQNEIWLMNGTQRLAIVPIDTVADTRWRAIAPFTRTVTTTLADIAGNAATNPFQLGGLNGSGRYYGSLGGADTNDFYRFSLGSTSVLNLALQGITGGALNGDLDIQVLTESGSVVAEQIGAGTGGETISNLQLNAGNYLIRVLPKAGQSSLYQLALNVNNFPVLASAGPLVLSEGATATISNTLLLVTDENDPPPQTTYNLVTLPDSGNLLSNGAALALNSIFTQADINSGRLSYAHNGSEQALDRFVFTVNDDSSPQGTIAATTFTISVIPVNDPPLVTLNTGATVDEGAAVTISTLSASDTEQTTNQLVYTLNSLPASGTLLLNAQAITLASATAVATFTQADINNNRLAYSHNGSETLSDRFTFTLTDQAGGTSLPAPATFSITVNAINDAPVLISNVGLTISEDTPVVISNTVLAATDAELSPIPGGADQLIYRITDLPDNGFLERDGSGPLALNSTFSQADIDNNRLAYTQSSTNEVNSDRFSFAVVDEQNLGAVGNPFTFNIAIANRNFTPVVTLNSGITVDEAAATTISSSVLSVSDKDNGSSQIIFTLSDGNLPENGRLLRDGTPLSVGQTFTQADINSNRITYAHNGSETLTDSFRFRIADILGAGPGTEQTFSITVTAQPDAPVLTTNLPLAITENQGAFLSSTLLGVSDPDSIASAIIYTIGAPPSAGDLIRGTVTLGANDTFTQAELAAGSIIRYQHNGSEAISDNFTFQLTDSTGLPLTPVDATFNIAIAPVNDAPRVTVDQTNATLEEGGTFAIAATNISASDPDGPNPIVYTIDTLPTSGQVLLGTTTLGAAGTFTESNIANGLLSYVHNGAEPAAATGSDRFTFRVADGSGAASAVTGFTLTINEANDAPVITAPASSSVGEDAPLSFGSGALAVSDPDSNPINLNLSVGAGTLTIPGTPPSSTIALSGSGSNLTTRLGNLIYRPNLNYFGPDTLTISADDGEGGLTERTISLNVSPVNDPPTLTLPGAQTVLEDQPLNLAIVTSDIDAGTNNVRATLSAINGTLTLNPGATISVVEGADGSSNVTFEGTIDQIAAALSTLTYRGNPDYFSPASTPDRVSVRIDDLGATGGGSGVAQGTIAIMVTSVNDPPSFTGGPDVNINEDAGVQTISGWATDIFRGAANEASQTLTFTTTVANPALFTSTGQPRVDPATGNLTFTSAPNAFGTTQVTVRLRDSGSNTAPNDNLSEDYVFTINVNSVNDAPTFTIPNRNVSATEDTPFSAVLATTIRPGANVAAPFNEVGQVLTFTVDSNSNPELFEVAPTIDPITGILTFTPVANANGQAIVVARLQDDGGIENGGVDTSALQTFTINVRAVNDAPVVSLPTTSLTIDEDQPLNITGVSVSDVDAGSGILEATLTALGPVAATNAGTLTVNGITGSTVRFTGTLDEINAALNSFTYTNRLNVSGEERISISVNDRGNTGGTSSPNLTDTEILTVNIQPINDAPTLTISNIVRSPIEDTPFTLSGITVSDVDAGGGNIQLTLTTLQPGGRIFFTNTTGLTEVGGIDLAVGAAQIVVQGTLATFRSTGLSSLRYQGALNYNGLDEISVVVSDLGAAGIGGALTANGTISLNVRAVNDAPTLTLPTGPLGINEDEVLSFINANAINLTDVDSADTPIRITLRVGTNGRLNIDDANLTRTAGSNGTNTVTYEGTVANIISAISTLTYTPNPNFFGSDTLTVTLNDRGATGATSGVDVTRTVAINVASVDDPPLLLSNGTLLVNEGAVSQAIANGLLRATDVDGPTPTFVVADLPDNGTLLINGVAATVGATFTQTQIQSSQVRYTHNGSETTADSFQFRLQGDPTATVSTFNITVNPISDRPVVTLNTPLTVNENNPPGSQSGNLRNLLGVSDPDSSATQIRYVLQAIPTSGSLRRSGNLTVGSSFTQADINGGSVTYLHNGSETTSDSFVFRVVDEANNSTNSTVFNIGITPVNDPLTIVTSGPVTISEGAVTAINSSRLLVTDPENQPVNFTLQAAPTFGDLLLNGTTILTGGSTFTQTDINSGRLSYRHNGSESPADFFSYRVTDSPQPAGPPLTRSGLVSIAITPVNDTPILQTPDPVITVEGSIPSQTSLDGILLVEDVDNLPGEITYRLITPPTVGELRLNGAPVSGSGFTQADIFAGNVTYFYDGVGTPGSDSFQFSANDGDGGTIANTFFNVFFTYPDS